MNINELDEIAKANSGLTSWHCNIPADSIRELIVAYRELVDAAKPFTSADTVDETSGTIPLMEALSDALDTAKRLGV